MLQRLIPNVFYSPRFTLTLLISLFLPTLNLLAEENPNRPDYGVSINTDGTWQWYLDNRQNNITGVEIRIEVESSTSEALVNLPQQNLNLEKDALTDTYYLNSTDFPVPISAEDSDTVLTYWVTVSFDNGLAFDFDRDQPIRFLLEDINRFRNTTGAQQIANYTIEFFSGFPAEIDIEQVNETGDVSPLIQQQALRQQDDNFYVYYLDVAEHELNSGDKLVYTLYPLENQHRLMDFKLGPRTFIYQVGELPSVLFTDQKNQVWYPNPENRIDDFHIKRPNGDSIKGDDVTIAGNDLTAKNSGLIGQLHRGNSNSTKLFYHLGQLGLNEHNGLDITWLYGNGNNDHHFEDESGKQIEGYHPSMSINNHGMIAAAYSKDNVAQIAFGTQDPNDPSQINFESYIDTRDAFGSDGNDGLSISLNDFNDFILIASEHGNHLSYIVGHYDPDTQTVTWGEKNAGIDEASYDTGRNVTVSLTNTGRVMEVHRTPASDGNALYFNRGQLDAEQQVVRWEENPAPDRFGTPYASGRAPAVALNEKLQSSAFHRNSKSVSELGMEQLEGPLEGEIGSALICAAVGTAAGGPIGAVIAGLGCFVASAAIEELFFPPIAARDIGFSLGYITPIKLEAVDSKNPSMIMLEQLSPKRGSQKQLGVMLNNQDSFCYIRSNGGSSHAAYLNYRCGHFSESKILKIGTPGSRITGLDNNSLHEIEFIPHSNGRFTVNHQDDQTRLSFNVAAGRTYNPLVQAGEGGGIDIQFSPDLSLMSQAGDDYLSDIIVYAAPSERPRRSIFPYEWQVTQAAGLKGEFKLDLVGLPLSASCEISVPILSDHVIALSDADEGINLSAPIDSQLYTFPIEIDGSGNAGELIVDIGGFNKEIESNIGEIKVMNCIAS